MNNITPTGSKRLNRKETLLVPTHDKLASPDTSVLNDDEGGESSSTLETQNWNKEMVPREYFLMINEEQIINARYLMRKTQKIDPQYEKDPSMRQTQNTS